MYQSITRCRGCGQDALVEVFALDQMPLADGFLSAEMLGKSEPRYPLTLAFCAECTLVQIRENVSPDLLFGDDYPYFSSVASSWVEHCREHANALIATRGLGPDHLVIELACNDGYMLRNFSARGIPTLGIDPAPGPAAGAEATGIPVIREFFIEDLAEKLGGEGKRADVVIANNVLAHVPDLRGFVRGIGRLLSDDGVAVIECGYVRDLIDQCAFDTIYHEHHCYFSATALDHLFRGQGLFLNDIRRIETQGGSLRATIGRRAAPSSTVGQLLAEERDLQMIERTYYADFGNRVEKLMQSLRTLLGDIKASGKRIVGYAAAAKGTMLLNAARIGTDVLDYVADRNPHKHGKWIPGVRIPIVDVDRLVADAPDYVLLLAWNLRDEILGQKQEYLNQGGQFICPVPVPEVIAKDP